MTPSRPTFADLFVAASLGGAAALLYAWTLLGRIYGNDGAMLADWTALPERAYHHYHNTLYLPAAALLDGVLPRGWLVAAEDPLAVAKSLSVVSAALGLSFTYLCCRWLGGARCQSVAATVLLGVSPVLWFFGVAIEVHALHFLVVAFAAFVTLAAPWHRPALATAITAVVFLLPYLSHQSAPVLGPGWLLLVQCARRRVGPRFSLLALFVIGVVLVGSLLLGHMLVQWRRGIGFTLDPGSVVTTVGGWRKSFTPSIVWDALLAPLCLLLPVAIVAGCWRRLDPWLRACAAVAMVPLIACVLWWGIPEQGGYLLGPTFLLAALAAAWWTQLPRGLWLGLAASCLLVQGHFGFRCVRDFDRGGFQLAVRVARVREHLGASGLVLSANDNAPNLAAWLPAVQEINLFPTLAYDSPVATWFQGIQPVLRGLASTGRFLFDTSYRLRTDLHERVRDSLARLEAALRADYRVTELADPSWPLWLVEKK